MPFMTEYAAYRMNRLGKREDGKLPYERIITEKPSVLGIEFGKKSLYKLQIEMKSGQVEWQVGARYFCRYKENE